MSHASPRRAGSLALALSALPIVLLPAAGMADTAPSTTKAAVEHAEQQAEAATNPNKAQIEHDETAATSPAVQQSPAPSSPRSSSAGGATAWQLALSAALGALVTGGAIVGSRRVGQHGEAVAS